MLTRHPRKRGRADALMTPTNRSKLSVLVLIVLFFAVSTIVMTYPLSIHPATCVPNLGDPLLFAWMLSWLTDAIVAHPFDLFQANAFFPFPDTLAFTDAPLGMLPIAAPVIWLTGNPVLAVNIASLAGFFLSGLGAYLLSWHLTRNVGAGVIAGIVFAFCPYRFAHLGHLQLLTAQWIPLALFFLHRGLEGRRRRDFFGFGACFVLEMLSSIYYALYLTLAVALFALYFAAISPRRHAVEFLLKLAAVSVCAGLVLIPYFQPYWRVQKTYGLHRPLSDLILFSADLRDYLAVPPGNIVGGVGFVSASPEHCLFPGLGPILFAVIGLFIIPPRRNRAGLAHEEGGISSEPEPQPWFRLNISQSQGFYLALAACGFVLSLGPTLQVFGHQTGITLPYIIIYNYVPGFDALRSVSRFGVMVFMAIAILAGEGFDRIVDGMSLGRLGRWSRIVVTGAMAFMVMSEYASFPVNFKSIEVGPQVPRVYRWLAHQEPGEAVLEFPFAPNLQTNARYEYFSAYHRRLIVNGYSGFFPPQYREMISILWQFPAGDSVGLLRAVGADLLIIHEDRYRPDEYKKLHSQMAANPELLAVQSFGRDHVYRVRARTGGDRPGESGTESELSESTRTLIAWIRQLTGASHSQPR